MTDQEQNLVTRAYRYALKLSDGQEAALQRQESQLRVAWNKMVYTLHRTLRECEWGRKTGVLAEIAGILSAKNRTGRAAEKANKLAVTEGISEAEALRRNRAAAVSRMNKFGARRLGVTLAQEMLMASHAKHNYSGPVITLKNGKTQRTPMLLYGLVQKFQKSCENWLKLVAHSQGPHYKRPQDGVALQRQITATTSVTISDDCDLSAFMGQAGAHCRVIVHRPLPASAVVKQLAISGRLGRRYLVVMFSCERADVEKPFAPSDKMAGVDTGLCMALTVTDQTGAVQEIQPPLCRDAEWLDKLAELQRQFDRQTRANNPHCFDDRGRWIKGKRVTTMSKGMMRTQLEMQKMSEKLADVRREHYHVSAFGLLKKYGKVAIGAWRPQPDGPGDEPAQPGKAIARRARNRIGYDHAISMFAAIIKDKAALAANQRVIDDVPEPWTTRTCSVCKKPSMPEGAEKRLTWKCPNCGTRHRRKVNNAKNILDRGVEKEALLAEVGTVPSNPLDAIYD